MKSSHLGLAVGAVFVSFVGLSKVDAPQDAVAEPIRGGLVTLYADDPLAHDFSFSRATYGGIFDGFMRKNGGADVDFGTYHPDELTVGIEGGRKGQIVDLGTLESLRGKYGYEETVGGGQGFASLRRDGGRWVILKDYRTQTTQTLEEARGLTKSGSHAPVADDHLYLVRLVDEGQAGAERFVKILVVSFEPGESVTLRWQLVD
jgi:hypothetical protein